MSSELFPLVIVLAIFSIYGWLSGIECAVSLLRVWPKLAPAKQSGRVFTPRWEITNVFLLLGCLELALFFPGVMDAIVAAVWPVLAIGLGALLVRAGLLLYIFAHKSTQGRHVANLLFVAVSLIVPLSLGVAGIYLVTGQPFWLTGAGWALFAALAVGLLALCAGFLYYIGGRQAPQGVVSTSRLLNLLLAALLALVLLEVFRGGSSHLLSLPYAYLAIISAGIVLMQSVLLAANKEWRMWWCVTILALIAPFLIGLANYPYLVYPDVLLDSTVHNR